MNSAFTLGLMAGCMTDFIRMTKSIAMVYTLGLIRRNMLAGGTMVNSMVSEFSFQKMGRKSWVSGKTVKNCAGSPRRRLNLLRVVRWT
jgi:hypothetical protein